MMYKSFFECWILMDSASTQTELESAYDKAKKNGWKDELKGDFEKFKKWLESN